MENMVKLVQKRERFTYVAAVDRLEEGDRRITGKVNILGPGGVQKNIKE